MDVRQFREPGELRAGLAEPLEWAREPQTETHEGVGLAGGSYR